MNAVEFKEGIENNKKQQLKQFLEEYGEKWEETLEDSVDNILKTHIDNGSTTEPFEIGRINHKILVEGGEWEDIDKYFSYVYTDLNHWEPRKVYNFPISDGYKYEEYTVVDTSKVLFWSVKHKITKFKRKKIEKSISINYSDLNWQQQKYFKKILTDRGFFVSRALNRCYARLDVYWNKDQYDLEME